MGWMKGGRGRLLRLLGIRGWIGVDEAEMCDGNGMYFTLDKAEGWLASSETGNELHHAENGFFLSRKLGAIST